MCLFHSAASSVEGNRHLAGRNGIKHLHDPGGDILAKQLEAAEAVVKQANEELLQAYKRAQAAESEAAAHQATKLRLRVAVFAQSPAVSLYRAKLLLGLQNIQEDSTAQAPKAYPLSCSLAIWL